MLTQYDIEYLVLFAVLAILFFIGLRPKEQPRAFQPLVIDKDMSQAIKGIACVLILMGHWGQRRFSVDMPMGVSKMVWLTTANIALVWFMFFSGYGLSLKKLQQSEMVSQWWKRCKKIYLPLLITVVVAFAMYAFLPESFSIEEAKRLWKPEDIHFLHHLQWTDTWTLLSSLFWNYDWYVRCILIFYTIYYVSNYVSKRFCVDLTALMGGVFLLYFIVAFRHYGWEEAHYFRYVWTFLLGHAVARRTKSSYIVAALFLPTMAIEGKRWFMMFFMAVMLLAAFSWLSKRYEIKGRWILGLGAVSYFFYLAHVRIGYVVLTYLQIDSILVWVAVTSIVAYLLMKIYDYLKNKFKVLR